MMYLNSQINSIFAKSYGSDFIKFDCLQKDSIYLLYLLHKKYYVRKLSYIRYLIIED